VIRVGWHPLARLELFEASGFYEGEAEGLGEIFLGAVEQGLERLRLHPRAGRKVLGQIRRYVVVRFPYSVLYRVEEDLQSDCLFILAVAHHKRRPHYWAKRI
jgi:plasmid stabilization system protein ParE